MADFIPSIPVRAAFQLFKPEPIVSGFLLLAQDVLKHPKDAESLHRLAADHFIDIFLDNGVVELGRPLPAKELVTACEILRPTYVFPPDIISNWEQTANLTTEFIQELNKHDVRSEIGIMRTIQISGTMTFANWSTYELQQIIRFWDDQPWTADNYWAIPRALGKLRSYIANAILDFHPEARFHYLGFRNDSISGDIQDCRNYSDIVTLDSGKPAAAGQEQIWLTGDNVRTELHNRAVPLFGYWDASMLTRAAISNVTFINGLLQHG